MYQIGSLVIVKLYNAPERKFYKTFEAVIIKYDKGNMIGLSKRPIKVVNTANGHTMWIAPKEMKRKNQAFTYTRKMYQGLKEDDSVKVIKPVTAFSSNYGLYNGIEIMLTPENIGMVGSTHVPSVRESNRPYGEYVCVDFYHAATKTIQRAAVSYDNLIHIKLEEK